MIPVLFSRTLAAGNAAGIAASQTPGAAGNLTLTASPVTLDVQRKVAITSAGNDSGVTFTVYGTSQGGQAVQETIAGGNAATVYTNIDFLTVTRVAISGAAAGAVTVGTNTVGSSPWFMPNYHITPFNLDFEIVVSGTVNYNLEYTDDDYFTPVTPTTVPQLRYLSVAQTATATVTATYAFRGWRLTTNSGSGTITVKAIQAGTVNY